MIIKVDKNKELKQQDFLVGTKELIALIYYQYIVTTQNEKQTLIKIWNKNEQLYQEKMKQKYEQKIFLKKKGNNLTMVEYKKSIFERIIGRIKDFFIFKKGKTIKTIDLEYTLNDIKQKKIFNNN